MYLNLTFSSPHPRECFSPNQGFTSSPWNHPQLYAMLWSKWLVTFIIPCTRSNNHQTRLLWEVSLNPTRWPYKGRVSEHLGSGKGQAAHGEMYLTILVWCLLSMVWGDGVKFLVSVTCWPIVFGWKTSDQPCTQIRATRLLSKSVDCIYCGNPYFKGRKVGEKQRNWCKPSIKSLLPLFMLNYQ